MKQPERATKCCGRQVKHRQKLTLTKVYGGSLKQKKNETSEKKETRTYRRLRLSCFIRQASAFLAIILKPTDVLPCSQLPVASAVVVAIALGPFSILEVTTWG